MPMASETRSAAMYISFVAHSIAGFHGTRSAVPLYIGADRARNDTAWHKNQASGGCPGSGSWPGRRHDGANAFPAALTADLTKRILEPRSWVWRAQRRLVALRRRLDLGGDRMGRSLEGFLTRKPSWLAGSAAVAVPSGPQPAEAWTGELQRIAGNQAVTRLLRARDAESPPGPHPGPALESGDAVAPPLVHRVVRSPGVPLDPDMAGATQVGIHADVRVHADEEAARSADAVHARAYAVGRHVVFARGQYDPASARGRSLLEHELTHVAQQGGGEAGGTIRVASAGAVCAYLAIRRRNRGSEVQLRSRIRRLGSVRGVPALGRR